VAFFAERLLGQALWDHQREIVQSDARHKIICSGRQAGKSTTLAVIALHTAFVKPGAFVLIVSAGEQAARDLLATCSMLAANPLVNGSVVDDGKTEMTLTNGSKIRSIPQSQRQARGPSADLLILDEACWIEDAVWSAAKFTTVARPASRIVMASTPYGRQNRFFAVAYRAGLSKVPGYESFHWPSTVSPLVDSTLIDEWRETDPERVFRAEVLADWVDDAGAYFTTDELDAALRDYELFSPSTKTDIPAVAGVDWGFARDASTVVLISRVDRRAEELAIDREGFWIPYLCERFRTPYASFVDHVEDVARGFRLSRIASEQNGVGAMPTQTLAEKLPSVRVEGVHTTPQLKEDGFGRVKMLLQSGLLALPRQPALLSQLAGLEYEQTDSGVTKIAVPERRGHDDLAMGLCLAVRADPSIGVRRRKRLIDVVIPDLSGPSRTLLR
jgi:phage FluMu gp28-like protein